MLRDADYFISNPDEFDKLSEEQQNLIYEYGELELEGDVNPPSIPSDAGNADNEEKVILSKNGKHEIPYSELEDARSEAQQWKAMANQLTDQLAAAKVADQGTGGTAAQQAVKEEFESQYPEIAEDLKPIIQKMIDEGIQAGINAKVAPLEQRVLKQAEAEHYKDILSEHKDAGTILDQGNKDFYGWAEKVVNIIDPVTRQALNLPTVLAQGNAAQVNEMLRQYKESQGVAVVPPPTGDIKDKLAGLKTKIPGTFSDIPGGANVSHVDEAARYEAMNDAEKEKFMFSMTHQQREDFFNRLM